MAQATTISLSKFTSAVQAAVKAAVANHPKFKIAAPQAISVAFLIRGFPVPEAILNQVTVGETQAFANEVAAQLTAAQVEVRTALAHAPSGGAVLSVGGHCIVGIPPATELLQVEK
ncbi:MAG TPA: hypothetical protein VMU80_09575 [Bryobacteraceae bacterium]|nr:hypothetical protein [Bryobacteraceae bacterium]HUO29456.1 hypothetical protein [Bryobacteraceae bacterium]